MKWSTHPFAGTVNSCSMYWERVVDRFPLNAGSVNKDTAVIIGLYVLQVLDVAIGLYSLRYAHRDGIHLDSMQ
eukprot:3005088-Ditylum_brightwellii.AAC.1